MTWKWLITNFQTLTNEFQNETLSILNDSFDEISPNLRNIVYHVDLLKQIVERQMKTTPKLERERKLELRNAETLIAITQEEIESKLNSIQHITWIITRVRTARLYLF